VRKPENRLGELNTNLHSFPPSHAATGDGCVLKHKIECIGNSDGIFHFEAGAPVRQVADSTIDRRSMTFEDDARSPENVARFISALLLGLSIVRSMLIGMLDMKGRGAVNGRSEFGKDRQWTCQTSETGSTSAQLRPFR
jgi:hypothetical protein